MTSLVDQTNKFIFVFVLLLYLVILGHKLCNDFFKDHNLNLLNSFIIDIWIRFFIKFQIVIITNDSNYYTFFIFFLLF